MVIKTNCFGFPLEYIVFSLTVIGKRLLSKGTFLGFVDVSSRHFVPLFNIFDLDFANCDCGVAPLVDPILHLLEPLHHFGTELVSHIIQEGELADAV